MKARIIKRTRPDKSVSYMIQQKHFLFRWWWVGVGCNHPDAVESFKTFDEAKSHFCYYDGTPTVEKVVYKNY